MTELNLEEIRERWSDARARETFILSPAALAHDARRDVNQLLDEIDRLRDELERETLCAIDATAEREEFRSEVEQLREVLEWMRQTIHRAYHDGPLDECQKNTCDAALQILGRRRRHLAAQGEG